MVARIVLMLTLVIVGELIFGLPYHTARFFRPTLLEAFSFTNTQLGDLFEDLWAGRQLVGTRIALVLVLRANHVFEVRLVFLGPRLAARRKPLLLDRGQHERSLVATHNRDTRIGPHPHHARAVSSTTHRVIACAERTADDDRELRYRRRRHGVHHLGPVLGNARMLDAFADHEARNVLQEQ